jgi:hypothetical protein
MKATLFSILLLFATTFLCGQDNTSDEYEVSVIPISIGSSDVYIEKFSPIYIQDLTDKQLIGVGLADSDDNEDMSIFIDLLVSYNKVYYRKFNSSFQASIENLKNKDKVKQMYLRDFNETADKNIRFIIRNSYSIIDIYSEYKRSGIRSGDAEFGYYIYDKQTDTKFHFMNDLNTLLEKLDAYYEFEKKGKLENLSQRALDKKLEKVSYKEEKVKSYSSVSWGVAIIAGLAIITNFILN